MATMTLSGLRHVYPNGHVGLDGIDLTVHDGEFLALLGPSGSGKTTLLRAIAGFIRPMAGTITIGDRTALGDGAWMPPEQRQLGMVFQNHAIWPHLSVARNVGYPLKLAGLPGAAAAARVREVLEKVGLAELGQRSPSALSGGQRQRVALARAIVAAPQALLLDEALSSLDEPLRARLRLELRALTREQGLTAVHVTHDRSEALALADRVAVLNKGRIEQVGTPAELVRAPASAFVASFVSDATIFPATGTGAGIELQEVEQPVGEGYLRYAPTLSGAGSLAGTALTAAVLPGDVKLRRLPSSSNSGAVITSALYGVHGYDVSADWRGIPLRAHVAEGWTPAVGDVVEPVIREAHVFPAGTVPPGTRSYVHNYAIE